MALNNPFMGTSSTFGSLTITMIGITVDRLSTLNKIWVKKVVSVTRDDAD